MSTAPSASTPRSTATVSYQFGSCTDTTSPGCTPCSSRKPATRHASSHSCWYVVRESVVSSTTAIASGCDAGVLADAVDERGAVPPSVGDVLVRPLVAHDRRHDAVACEVPDRLILDACDADLQLERVAQVVVVDADDPPVEARAVGELDEPDDVRRLGANTGSTAMWITDQL